MGITATIAATEDHFNLLCRSINWPGPFRDNMERSMQGLFEYKLESKGDALALGVDLDSVSAKALVRLDRYINWSDVLKLTENDPEAAYAAERLHTVLQHLGR
jgi:hypothetical protein